jgi:aminoglycoside phosphotransferase family enzyme/predicted kinase
MNGNSGDSKSQAQSQALLDGLMRPQCYDHPVIEPQIIETHISWVILTGDYVYKIKKPVDLGFLDFSSLEKRHFYCQQELILNQRLAAEIYLEVVTVNGTSQNPQISGQGPIIEYAVKMIQFPQSSQLDRMLQRGELKAFHLDAFAELIADFHQNNAFADNNLEYGEPLSLLKPVKENFSDLQNQLKDKQLLDRLNALESWSNTAAVRLQSVFKQRKRQSFIRECHGDLHLRNMAWVNNKPLLFDCIEFDDNLRWIDVISEIAFLIMDLHKNGCYPLASRFLNHYLECTGDYAGVAVLPFYVCYRAMVRGKVEAIKVAQSTSHSAHSIDHSSPKTATNKAFEQYLQLAQSYIHTNAVKLIITHGFSACGKTTVSQQLLEHLGAIRIRSDVERKRLFGMHAKDDGQANIGKAIYAPEASEQTYAKLMEFTKVVLDSGYSVIIDAAFLKISQRRNFQEFAEIQHIPFIILDITAKPESLRERIELREKGASDADKKVLEHQLISAETLTSNEKPSVITVDTEVTLDAEVALDAEVTLGVELDIENLVKKIALIK